jgi:uncharacterized Zn-binding protein involved in type VI secretion
MKTLARTFGFGIALMATFAGFAAAATLAVGSSSLSAGNGTVSSCGVTSLGATRSVDNAGNVTQVDVAGIPATCAGETLTVTLTGASNAAIGSGTATIGTCGATCSATVSSFGGTVSASSLLGYAFAVQG